MSISAGRLSHAQDMADWLKSEGVSLSVLKC
jgi:hypothetical protein